MVAQGMFNPPLFVPDMFASQADYDLSNFGPQVLYASATGLEKALADIDVEHLIQIQAELIRDNWNPFKVQLQNLPFLAFALGVSLWEDPWSEGTRRSWVANQWEFKARRGTKRAIKMALDVNGFDLVQELTPPQGFYLTEDTGEEVDITDAFMGSFLGHDRIGIAPYTAYSLIDLKLTGQFGFFVGGGAVEIDFIADDDLSSYDRARRAVVAAKALRDELFVNFAPLRRLTVIDGLVPGRKVGDYVRRNL